MKHAKHIQISIPQPCTEYWDNMTPKQQNRYCESCRKCVVDFTEFTDEQLYKFFEEHKGQKVCGRLSYTQLNRTINLPPQPHSTLYKWIIAAGIALVLIATPEASTFARAPLCIEYRAELGCNPAPHGENDAIVISGKVIDEQKEPVHAAGVTLYRNGNEVVGGVVTDTDGHFSFTVHGRADYSISVRYIGYNEATMKFNSKQLNTSNDVIVKLHPGLVLGELVIIEYCPPIIDKYEHGSSKTIYSDELKQMGH